MVSFPENGITNFWLCRPLKLVHVPLSEGALEYTGSLFFADQFLLVFIICVPCDAQEANELLICKAAVKVL